MSHSNSTATVGVGGQRRAGGAAPRRPPRRDRAHAARPHQPAAETVAANHGGHVQNVAANASAVRHRGQEAHVAGQGAQIAEVVGDPLQFHGHAAKHWARAGTRVGRQRLDRAAVRHCVADRRVARERLGVVDRPRQRAADHRPFHAAVLIAQRDFQVVHRFAMALEAKMSGLDDARVHRANGHLVHLVAGHLEEVGYAA